ncbi:DNA utilization protein GntX [Botrimarina colliarenosi]|uniref:DNA utilization protein GntX n=1 Tax=Botrimarina colliarenosi TaxID=2528001 RepID=A0A5C6AMH1_9BACT|nr:double zinc ribbon domain-containing protein [Botrimarina colliarenosi]TWT99373.1 DNA utilization protein GntX [Botrimarina colliarenosi]
MSRLLRSAVSLGLDLAFPPTCPACGRGVADRLGDASGFCADCLADLPLLPEPACRRCATPLATSISPPGDDCPACRDERWAFDESIALGAYDGLLRRLVLDGKRAVGEPAMQALGRRLAGVHRGRLSLPGATVVVPTPQHWRRRLVRRADGVAALAGALAAELRLPVVSALRRTRATRRQTAVASSDRRANVRGAFAVRPRTSLKEKMVLLVDDVLTTGSTCHAASQTLKKAGVARVVVVVAAKRLGPA